MVLEGQWTRRVQPQQLEGAQKRERAGVGLRFFFSTPNESEDLNTKTWHPNRPLIVPLLVRLFPPRRLQAPSVIVQLETAHTSHLGDWRQSPGLPDSRSPAGTTERVSRGVWKGRVPHWRPGRAQPLPAKED